MQNKGKIKIDMKIWWPDLIVICNTCIGVQRPIYDLKFNKHAKGTCEIRKLCTTCSYKEINF